MRKLLLLLLCPTCCFGQLWNGILTSSTAVDWSGVGVVGGIPSGTWTQSGSTITAAQAPCSNDTGDCTSTIQTALNACGTNHYVLLGPGTFRITAGAIVVPSNCELRGSGPDQTTLDAEGSNINILYGYSNDNTSPPLPASTSTPRTTMSNALKDATTIVVASASGISVGTLLYLTQANYSYMTELGQGNCNFCNYGMVGEGDSGQVVRVTNVSGTTLTIDPPLVIGYANTPTVYPFTRAATVNAGVSSLKLSGHNTQTSGANEPMILMMGCYNCWLYRYEGDFADNAHMFMMWDVHCEVRDSYFHDAFLHGAGQTDSQLNLAYKTTASLIINNIFWRLHAGIMNQRGPAGNVIAYNYLDGNYNVTGGLGTQEPGLDTHGAHPMMNLYEGNITNFMLWDDQWGSSSHHTLFRNYVKGTTFNVPPRNARGTLTPGSGQWEDSGNSFGIDLCNLNTSYNLVGIITGSAHATAQGYVDSRIDPATPATGASCIRYGYPQDFSAPSTVSPNTVYSTTFIHGVYGCNSGTFTWDSGHSDHTLPASFFLSSKPSWWGTQPWPPIGPDVTSGNLSGSGGFANTIPALDCFNIVTSSGTINTGAFTPATCYAATAPATAPAPVMFMGNINKASGSAKVQ